MKRILVTARVECICIHFPIGIILLISTISFLQVHKDYIYSNNISMPQKKEWPELVGVKGEEAEKRVKHDDPTIQTQIIEEDMMYTSDYRLDRVRIFINNAGNVAKAPKRG